uniref:Uncharacterized protein n=1 Tax=uncultured organism Bio4 TaxID=460931 RepID=B2BKA5_9ZZZZ|nr:unknown [uncultured organism Bio4]
MDVEFFPVGDEAGLARSLALHLSIWLKRDHRTILTTFHAVASPTEWLPTCRITIDGVEPTGELAQRVQRYCDMTLFGQPGKERPLRWLKSHEPELDAVPAPNAN